MRIRVILGALAVLAVLSAGAASAQELGQLGSPVPVRVRASAPGLTLHRHVGSGYGSAVGPGGTVYAQTWLFDRLCAAPCETRLVTGTHQLGVSMGMGTPQLTPPVQIDGPTDLDIDYRSRVGIRRAGLVSFLVGTLGGPVLLTLGLLRRLDPQDGRKGMLIAGGVLTGAGFVVGMTLMMQRDRVAIRVTPTSM